MLEHWQSEIKAWIKRATNGDGSLTDWFLFIGFVTAVTILWKTVINRLVD